MTLSHATPILPVDDPRAAADHYEALGFTVDAYRADYLFVLHEGREVLHLSRVDGLDPATNPASAYLHVRDVDAWHAAMAGTAGVGSVTDTEWGMREYVVTDPSGNAVRIGQNR